MCQCLGDFVFQGLVSPLKFNKMSLDRHIFLILH